MKEESPRVLRLHIEAWFRGRASYANIHYHRGRNPMSMANWAGWRRKDVRRIREAIAEIRRQEANRGS